MRKPIVASVLLAAALGVGALGAGMVAGFGPPIVCHPIAIGEARSLPWESGAFSIKKGYYSRARLVEDVAAILKTEANLLVRMETLRRAAVYLREGESGAAQRGVAWEILGRIIAGALEQEASGKSDPVGWLDAAFLVAAYDQAGVDLGYRAGVADGIDGYAFMSRAVETARGAKDARAGEIEYAAALMTVPAMRSKGRTAEQAKADQETYEGHVRAAAQAARPGSLLETNLSAHLSNWGRSLEKVRAEAKTHGERNVSARK